MEYYVYILRTSGGTLYVGQTNNIERRLQQHRDKKGKEAKYLRSFQSFDLVHTERYLSRSEALRREYQLKQLTKQQKEEFLQEFSTISLRK